ncbi:MAG: OpgC domain-containing protein [Gemmobacter sp.]|jgi:hypothetical protein|nr:OpgC domain-containing protein [Gemmobacter sp.]
MRGSDAAVPQAVRVPSIRDPRLDVFRGLCLVMIFINHTPGTVFEHFTSRNFGFSDAAEAFVLMSGIAAGIAYGKYFTGPSPASFWAGTGRIWRRVWTLYQVHIVTTVMALGLAAATAYFFGGFEAMQRNAIRFQYQMPLQFLIGIPLLTHQIGYANILPLYAVLLFVAPLTLWAGARRPKLVMTVSVLLWLGAAMTYLNLPNFPMRGGWFFNPISWQVIFTLGLLSGLAMRRGERFVPRSGWLLAICIAWLLFALLAARNRTVSEALGHTLHLTSEYLHVHWIFVAFDKTYLALPRLSHALALAYVLANWPLVRRLCATRGVAPFALLGRHGLAVFGLGVVLCYGANGAKLMAPPSLALDSALIGGGVALMMMLAWSKEAWRRAETRGG